MGWVAMEREDRQRLKWIYQAAAPALALAMPGLASCSVAVDAADETAPIVANDSPESPSAKPEPQLAIDPAFAEWHLPTIESAVEEWFQAAPSLRIPVVLGTEGTVVIRYEQGSMPVDEHTGVRRLGQFGAQGITIWSDWMKSDTLRAVVLHEVGHWLGADHLPADADPRAVMHEAIEGWPGRKCITHDDLDLVGVAGASSCDW